MDINFEKALELWTQWNEVRKLMPGKTETASQFLHCECAQPALYWDESPSNPDQYETEYCRECGHYTDWNRIKNGADIHGWHREQNIQTGEVRFRSENESLLLTASEHESRVFCRDGNVTDENLKAFCRTIAKSFEIPTAQMLIHRRFGRTPAIAKSAPNGRVQSMVMGMISGKEGQILNF